MNRAQIFLKRNSPTILSIIGSVGVVVTTVLAVKATPKALELIEDEKTKKYLERLDESLENGWEDYEPFTDLKPLEVVKVAWKPYIPAAISGLATIACILGANCLNTRSQAKLMSAYALLDNSFKEYRNKTRELYTDEAVNIEHEMIKSQYDNSIILHNGNELFYDFQSRRYFESSLDTVKRAEFMLNQKLTTHGCVWLNDFYDFLGIPRTEYGYYMGWSIMKSDKMYAYDSILLELEYEKTVMDDGLECNIITIKYPPSLECIR